MTTVPVRICFVCSGNICRSPTAEVVFNRLAAEGGRSDLIAVDSAGTGNWHEGEDLDPRARRTLVHAGYDVPVHSARQFTAADFAQRDLVVALDAGHLNALWWLANENADGLEASDARAKLVLLRAFDPHALPGDDSDVPDPYYGGPDGFRDVLAMVERGCAGLLRAIEDAADSGDSIQMITAGLQQTGRPPL